MAAGIQQTDRCKYRKAQSRTSAPFCDLVCRLTCGRHSVVVAVWRRSVFDQFLGLVPKSYLQPNIEKVRHTASATAPLHPHPPFRSLIRCCIRWSVVRCRAQPLPSNRNVKPQIHTKQHAQNPASKTARKQKSKGKATAAFDPANYRVNTKALAKIRAPQPVSDDDASDDDDATALAINTITAAAAAKQQSAAAANGSSTKPNSAKRMSRAGTFAGVREDASSKDDANDSDSAAADANINSIDSKSTSDFAGGDGSGSGDGDADGDDLMGMRFGRSLFAARIATV